MAKRRTKLAKAKLRKRKAALDVKIARVRREIKTLKGRLKKREGILARRLSHRAKLK